MDYKDFLEDYDYRDVITKGGDLKKQLETAIQYYIADIWDRLSDHAKKVINNTDPLCELICPAHTIEEVEAICKEVKA